MYGMMIRIVKTAVNTKNAIEAGHGITDSDELNQSATVSVSGGKGREAPEAYRRHRVLGL